MRTISWIKGVQTAIQLSSGYVAIINQNIDKAPDEIFTLIQQAYPDVTKDSLKDFINGILVKLDLYGAFVPPDFETALQELTIWLKGFSGNIWIGIVRLVVAIGSEVLNPSETPMQKIDFVLELVYRNIVQPFLAKYFPKLPEPAGLPQNR